MPIATSISTYVVILSARPEKLTSRFPQNAVVGRRDKRKTLVPSGSKSGRSSLRL